jgi:peptide/nickel transport system permease protein
MYRRIHHELGGDPWFVAGAGVGLFLLLLVVLGPALAPHEPYDMSFIPLSPPSAGHWLGVNDGGMDIFSELLYGMRNTVAFGLVAGLVSLALGAAIGLAAAWFGGLTDQLSMRLADILLAIPAVMILILIAALFRPTPFALALTLSIMLWPTTAKGVRAQALVVKNGLHIHAAGQMGASGAYIIVFMEASLAFLGLFDPSRKSLGIMISYALKYYYLDIWWNWLLPPVFLLSLLIMTVTFLAISLEKVFDPRLKEAM